MKIDLTGSVVTLTVTEDDLIPMLKEYIQRKLGAGDVKIDMCLSEPCCVEFTPTLQPTQVHKRMMCAVKDSAPLDKTVGGYRTI
jgi:hypothetical protein